MSSALKYNNQTPNHQFNYDVKKSYDFLFKILLCGDAGVGKTGLIHRFCDAVYCSTYVSTIGIDFRIKTIVYRGRIVKLQIWDPAGQERFSEIIRAYFRGAHAVMFVYDITRKETFEHIRNWIGRVEDELGATFSTVPKILIGNKCDVPFARQVAPEQGEEVAYFLRMRFKETSVLTDEQVNEAFTLLVHDLVLQKEYEMQNGILTIESETNKNRGFTLARSHERKSATCSKRMKDSC